MFAHGKNGKYFKCSGICRKRKNVLHFLKLCYVINHVYKTTYIFITKKSTTFRVHLHSSSGQEKKRIIKKKRELDGVRDLGTSSRRIMTDGKEVPTKRATWMFKYKKGSLKTKFPKQYPAQYYREGYKNLKPN